MSSVTEYILSFCNKGNSVSEPSTDVIIMELDNAYAFILYHKKGKITAKLYGESLSYATATLSVLHKG